ncbi:hypothetical protein P7C70_g643, partial [Phenoliferia sp. Uapishka_3]
MPVKTRRGGVFLPQLLGATPLTPTMKRHSTELNLDEQIKQLKRVVQQLEDKRSQQLDSSAKPVKRRRCDEGSALSPGSEADASNASDEDEGKEEEEAAGKQEFIPGETFSYFKQATKDPIRTVEEKTSEGRNVFIWRCCDCYYELWDALCLGCTLRYDLKNARATSKGQNEEELEGDDVGIDDEAGVEGEELAEYEADPLQHPDRALAPRGTTPLDDFSADSTPTKHENTTHSPEEFQILLSRGATPEMISLFQLEFADEDGIIAWADDGVFEAFSGEEMQEGDTWKISLGRRLTLAEDDVDGSAFVDTMLDDVYYSSSQYSRKRWAGQVVWETTRVGIHIDLPGPSVWQTKPQLVEESDDPSEDEFEAGNWSPTHRWEERHRRIPGPIAPMEPHEDMSEESEASVSDYEKLRASDPDSLFNSSGESSLAGSDWDSNFDSSAEEAEEDAGTTLNEQVSDPAKDSAEEPEPGPSTPAVVEIEQATGEQQGNTGWMEEVLETAGEVLGPEAGPSTVVVVNEEEPRVGQEGSAGGKIDEEALAPAEEGAGLEAGPSTATSANGEDV